MATTLAKPVSREVATEKYGALIVTLTPQGLVIREKGRRAGSAVGPQSYTALYEAGLVKEAERVRALKLRENGRHFERSVRRGKLR